MTNKTMSESKKPVVYIDLDNTLVDFMSGVKKYPEEFVAPYKCDENGKNTYDNIPGVFARMDAMKGAEEAFRFMARNFDVYILSTAPWNNPTAWYDKLEWVKKHLGGCDKNSPVYKRLILSHHKELLRGDYIIDDSTKNGVSEFQGRHIQIGSEEFPDWATIIDWFKKNEID